MLSLPKIGQGTGYDLYKNKVNKKRISHAIEKGVELGLNLIDTAQNYCNGEIEKIIGKIVQKKRHRVIICTKFPPGNSSYKKVIKSCNGSLKRLKTDYIDIYQIHWPNPKVNQEETLEALSFLKKSGKIREFGVGNYTLELLKSANKIFWKGKIFSLQTEFNIFERTIEQNGILNFCKRNNIRVIAFSPLDQGRLDAMNQNQKIVIKKIAKYYGRTVSQIILSWIISKKIVPIPMSLNLSHIRQNADSSSIFLERDHLKQIDEVFYTPLEYISTDLINVPNIGERHSLSYRTLREAYENRLKLTPSPRELAQDFKKNGFLKPVRLVKSTSSDHKYDLISGRVRYWAWVIAYGNKRPIPAYIRKNLKMA